MTKITIIEEESIVSKIYIIRGKKVMLDRDLAELYQVETKRLNEQVRRNARRFPDDFMFQLTKDELEDWKSQIATSNSIKMGLRKPPFAFTENGVAMLSSVLNSERAIEVNIQIMRIFTNLRKQALTNIEILKKLEEMDRKFAKQDLINHRNDQQFKVVFDAIKNIIYPKEKPKKIGFIKDG
jgi:hypothetical protein